MENQAREQVENLRFVMKSPWTKNRSKYMVLHTIQEDAGKSDLIFILFYTPVPYMTVESSLRKWIGWGYLKEVGDHCYILGAKGRHFLQREDKKIGFIVDSWNHDLMAWRALSKDYCRTPDGKSWLPKAEMIKVLDDMKFHRIGSRRLGSKAGRPANPAPGPEPGAVQSSTPAATMPPAPKVPEVPRTTVAPAHPIELPDAPVIQSWSTATGKSEQEEAPPWPRCPSCHRPLEPGYHYWYCSVCDLSYDAAWEPMKGKR